MRKKDLFIGAQVWCNSSATKVQVEVVAIVQRQTFGTRSGRNRAKTMYRIRNFRGELPKLRSARELHICGHGEFPSFTEVQDTSTGCAECAVRFGNSWRANQAQNGGK